MLLETQYFISPSALLCLCGFVVFEDSTITCHEACRPLWPYSAENVHESLLLGFASTASLMATQPSYAAMAQHASFEHERLKLSDKSIRLFQVRRGAKNEPISLRMTQFSEHRRPPYKAVSYTWGSPENPHQILVNGRAFELHLNLWNLLYHLRLKGETSFLWADALCINQQNMRERNFHVQLMGKIYEKASCVIVWLGIPSPDRVEIRAMDFVREIATFRNTNSDVMVASTFFKPELQHRWETLLRMTRHVYFTRTWIIQEFLFAPAVEMLSGASSLAWKHFEDLIDLLRDNPRFLAYSHVPEILTSRITRLTLRRRAGSQSTLHELLQEYSDSTCTERRDKIYGILGLASDCAEDAEMGGGSQSLTADYEKLVIEVFMDALACIKSSLPTDDVLPAAVLLLLQALHVTQDDVVEYLTKHGSADGAGRLFNEPLNVPARYMSPILKVWSWKGVRDLQQQLESYDWGQHIGYEIQKVPSNQLSPPVKQASGSRRNSSRTIHSALPPDLIPNAVEAANLCTELVNLHNYPCNGELVLPLEHLALHEEDKRAYDNADFQKPPLILEQDADSEILRLGFASTNVQRGDFVVQFQGLDTTLITRQTGYDFKLVGKAMMLKHADIVHDGTLDPICDPNVWTSHCWCGRNPDDVRFETDALSLAELIRMPMM